MDKTANTDEYIAQLESKCSQLKNENTELQNDKTQLKNRNTFLENKLQMTEEQLKVALLRRFGRSADQIDTNQEELFDEAELQENNSGENESIDKKNETIVVESHNRKKCGRKPLPAHLPHETTIIDIPEEEKHCACGAELVKIGEEKTERLHIVPPQVFVEVIIRPKYACRVCEGSGDEDKPVVRVAPAPATIIPGSITTPGLLSFVFTNKYCMYLPYYRQENGFKSIGVTISRQNMSNWQQKVYQKLLPMEEMMKNHLKTGHAMQMDETTVQVMGEENRPDTAKSYMWLGRGGPPDKPVVVYEYHPGRKAAYITDFLDGFSGFLQTDGYQGYESALAKHRFTHPEDKIIHAGCLAHVRRNFFEASKTQKKSKSPLQALSFIKKIYQAEDNLRKQNLADETFLEKRKETVLPLFEKFKTWLDKKLTQIPPSLTMGKAVKYALNQWPFLIAYLDCASLTPDNNKAEQSIKPFVMGRKNWMFSGSPAGAKSSCFLYTLIETAKANNIEPVDYLRCLFEQAPLCNEESELEQLLPWNITISKFQK